MSESGPSYPNLAEVLGAELARRLVAKAGGLAALARCSDKKLRHLGVEEVAAERAALTPDKLHAGLIAEAPLFREAFGDETARANNLEAARKALALLGRKSALCAKADAAGGGEGGEGAALGREQAAALREAFARLLEEGKVSAEDTRALPVPEVLTREQAAALRRTRRGGVGEHRKRQREAEGAAVERATARVRLGVSEEEQRAELLQRSDLWADYQRQQERDAQRAAARQPKKPLDDDDDDYGDLFRLQL